MNFSSSAFPNLEYLAEIARLAALSAAEYDHARAGAAQRFGVRTATLDDDVRRARTESRSQAAEGEDARPPEFTDEALAQRFTAAHGARLRYVAAWGRWVIWDETVWQFDDTLQAFDVSRRICRQASAECNCARTGSAIASAKTVAAVEKLAKADRAHAATVEQWDTDPWLLNTPSGLVDLRSGQLQPHRPNAYATKITAVGPGDDCPRWLAFLDRVTGSDQGLIGFLQRMAGYALTGSTAEHALFFLYGTGANGKGTFLNTLTAILGDYATVASMETFTASQAEKHPTDLAMLRGARLVTAQETEEGRRWAEAKIKAMTGGDPITARFMRQDFFTFTPTFKLCIAGNHKPGLRNVDEAIRRRLHLLPFEVKIPASERDQSLAEKLRGEWPGILQWMVDGCLEWQRIGLAPPEAVTRATEQYLETEDMLGLWIAERCRMSISYQTSVSDLFTSWKIWAEAAGESVGSQKSFGQKLEARGFERKRTNSWRGFIGLTPLSPG